MALSVGGVLDSGGETSDGVCRSSVVRDVIVECRVSISSRMVDKRRRMQA